MTTAKPIGIAVVEHAGRYLIGIRGPDVPLAGFAEFPGGKCRPAESPFDCAIRECLEETGLAVTAVRMIERIEFEYPHDRVDLHFVLCHPLSSQDVCEQHRNFHWATAYEMKTMKFPDANRGIIKRLIG